MYNLEILKKTIKYPTSLIVGGIDAIGIELAKALLEQGGFVIIVDNVDEGFLEVIDELKEFSLFAYFDYSQVIRFEDYLRRLDYVFYLSHNINSLDTEISSQDFLEFSKFLDQVLVLSTKYNSKFLGSTSVAAHQNLVENKIHAIEFADSDRINTVYTQAEIQRYTESLALEYHSKSQLNARIVRLGIVIGSDSYIGYDSKIGKLISDALFEDVIKVQGDGLDSDYYIDIKDAVYGIIKAQFSKDTSGEIFSIAFENEISILSIVYKLNELIEYPKEIIFSDTDLSYKSFRLYKPAPNLMRIGWSPRVSFERSLKQTIEDYKNRKEAEIDMISDKGLDEFEEQKPTKKKKSGNFLSWLFFKSEEEKVVIEPEGALSHLIEERKKSNENRKGSILMANRKVDTKNSKNVRPRNSRFKGNLIRTFDRVMSPFDSLRYITIRQFIFILILSIVLIFLYFTVFVGLVDGIKQTIKVNNTDKKITEGLQSKQNYYINYSTEFENISKATDSINNDFQSYKFLNDISQYNQFQTKLGQTSNSIREIYSGTKDLDFVLQSTKDFLNAYNEKVVYKQYNQSIIGVENKDLIIKEFDNYSPSYSISADGLKSIRKGIQELDNIDSSKYNPYLKNFVDNFVNNAKKVETIYQNLNKVDHFLPALVGEGGEKSYVIVLVDNTLYSPAGGYPVSEMFVTYNKGKLTNLRLMNTQESTKFPTMDEFTLADINMVKTSKIGSSEVTYNDIFYSDQGNLYLLSLKDYYLEQKKLDSIDGVIVINLNFLADLLNIQEPIEVENKVFNKETLFGTLNELTIENDSDLEFRKELISNVFALTTQNLFNNLNGNIFEIAGIIENNIMQKNIVYSFSDNLFDSYLNIDPTSDDNVQGVLDYISISAILQKADFNYKNDKIIFDTNIDINIDEEGRIRKTVEIVNESEQKMSAILVCLPAVASNFEFLESTQLATDLKINNFETCLNLKIGESKIYKFSYDMPNIEIGASSWDYTFGMRKQPGTTINLSAELTSKYGVITATEELEVRDKSKAGFNGELINDKLFRIKFQ
ncbi:NAD(P)-dependent oxidoreductase [Candidatus Dojkabacteria bacterium]|nr:NAD(P)-dependent oxidoreductase [Candidatus Dojkabacteria bacterium]